MLTVASDVESLLDALAATKHVHLPKPIEYARPVDDLQRKPELAVNAASHPAPLFPSCNNLLSPVVIEDLQLRLEWIPLIARWHFDAWGTLTRAQTFERYVSLLEEAANGCGIPSLLVASENGALVGSVSLVASDMSIRRTLTPWLAQLFVTPEYRHQGIGAALVRAATSRARSLGFRWLYLYTSGDLPRYYERLEWIIDERVEYLGKERTVMRYDLVADPTIPSRLT